MLKIAQASYPRAWLAVNDEKIDLSAVEHAGVASTAAATDRPTRRCRTRSVRESCAMRATRSRSTSIPEAIDLLNRLLRQPEYPARADAQELMGLVRERAGQLAQAKAEYQEYLRRYPERRGAARVRGRLQALAAASLAPKSTGEFGAAAGNRWTMAGSAAVTYQYGKDQTTPAARRPPRTRSIPPWCTATCCCATAASATTSPPVSMAATRTTRDQPSAAARTAPRRPMRELTDRIFGVTARVRPAIARQPGHRRAVRRAVRRLPGQSEMVGERRRRPAGLHQLFGGLESREIRHGHRGVRSVPSGLGLRRLLFRSDQRRPDGSPLHRLPDPLLRGGTHGGRAGRLRHRLPATQLGDPDRQRQGGPVLGAGFRCRPSPQPLAGAQQCAHRPDLRRISMRSRAWPRPPPTPSQLRQLALDRTATSNTVVLSASRPFGERWQFMADSRALSS